jgi:hypothetical protein
MENPDPFLSRFAKAEPMQRLAAVVIDLFVMGVSASVISFCHIVTNFPILSL